MMLLNPAYTGRRATTPGWDGRGHRPDYGTTILITRAWPAILDDATYAGLLTALRDAPGNPNTWEGQHTAKHLLTGLTYCGTCGGPMYVQHNRSRARYTCMNQPGAWGEVVRKASDVEAKAARVVLAWMSDGGLYDQARRAAESDDVKALTAELDAAIAERRRIVRAVAIAEMTDDEIRGEVTPVLARIDALRTRRDAAAIYDDLGDVTERGPAFAAAWEGWDTARRRELLARLVSRVVIYPAPLRGGKAADPRFIRVHPAGWAAQLADPDAAAPEPAPDAEAATSRGMVRAYLAARPGMLADAAAIVEGTGLPLYTVRVALRKLTAAGEIKREWCPAGLAGTQTTRGAGCYACRLAGNEGAGLTSLRPMSVEGHADGPETLADLADTGAVRRAVPRWAS